MASKCLQCGFKNPPDMRFCGNCGTRLGGLVEFKQVRRAQDGLSSLGTDTIIDAVLVERFQQAGAYAAGQRRNVTVLFADLSGYTDISGLLETEDVYDVIQEFISLLINDIYIYEGIVDKVTGDGLMALFGAPIAHENNAERAVRAAIDMQADVAQLSQEIDERYGIKLKMRLGLHSGSVIVGGIGTNLLMDYTAIGDTVNLANRIEEAATPGAILVSQAVYRQTSPLFNYQPIHNLQLKGLSTPITAYQLLDVKKVPGSLRGIEGMQAPMVGREKELSQLIQSVEELSQKRRGRFIFLTGEAGIGKSRLISELSSQIDKSEIQLVKGHSLTYRRSVSYWIFLEVLRSYLDISADATVLEINQRLDGKARQALGKNASDVIPYLQHLLSVSPSNPTTAERIKSLDANTLRQQIFQAVRGLLIAEAHRQPIILILEDLHWADDASLDLLSFLLTSVRSAPLLILAISRPFQSGILKRIAKQASIQIPELYESIRLPTLSRDQAQYLLDKLLSISHIPPGMREQILQKSAGVPFYLEEILRNLIDNQVIESQNGQWRLVPDVPTTDLGVPESLQGLILARFDRLDKFSRKLLQIASVIGHQFDLALLMQLVQEDDRFRVEKTLESLVEREFLVELSGKPIPNYEFGHVLMSEAIYSTLLRRDRGRLHGEVGRAIETIHSEPLHEEIELLARHYSWSPQLDKALHYLILAGQKAANSYIIEQAREHFEGALEILDDVDHTLEQALQVYQGLGDVLVLLGKYKLADRYYQCAVEKIVNCSPNQQHKKLSRLYRKIAKTFERQGDYAEALNYLELAEKELSKDQVSHSVERSQILNDIGWIHYRQGNFPEAEKWFHEALGLVEDSDAYDAIASIYNYLSGTAKHKGD